MPMAEKIRIALIKHNMSLKELSSRLGCTSQNLSGKLKRDNFSERELIELPTLWIVILKAVSLVMITAKKSKAIRA